VPALLDESVARSVRTMRTYTHHTSAFAGDGSRDLKNESGPRDVL
jgi:hypothetical protein